MPISSVNLLVPMDAINAKDKEELGHDVLRFVVAGHEASPVSRIRLVHLLDQVTQVRDVPSGVL